MTTHPSAPELFETITQRGHRLTRARKLVIQALVRAEGPVSVKALQGAVGAQAADLVTLYRTLHWLVELGLVRAVPAAGGPEHFELVPRDDHTHHLHCDGCGALRTVPVCGVDAEVFDHIAREFGFVVEQHRLTFHGRCSRCAGG